MTKHMHSAAKSHEMAHKYLHLHYFTLIQGLQIKLGKFKFVIILAN